MNILFIFPHGNALNPISGAGTRIWNIINSLLNSNHNISILHSHNSHGNEIEEVKNQVGVFYYKELKFRGISDWYITDFNPFFYLKIISILKSKKFDIIQIEFPWGFLITKLIVKQKSKLVYDSLGVEAEFIKIATKHPKFPKILKFFAIKYAKIYEKLVCKLTDAIINVSNLDRNYYIKNYKINPKKAIVIQISSCLTKSNLIYDKKIKAKYRAELGLPNDKTVVIFHGGLPHPPNQEAFDLIEYEIAPKLSESNILFVIAGYNLKVFKKKNLFSLGYVKNLEKLLITADFAIVPIISGSGMRVKCSDYIKLNLPFITTKKGIEGIEILQDGIDCIICEDINDKFLNSIHLLHKNIKFRNFLQENLSRKSQLFDIENLENKLNIIYKKIKNNELLF